MLKKQNRLIKNRDFEKVFKQGKGIKENFLYCKFIKNSLNFNRVGFIVSKKVSKKGVIRNKIKRRLREITRKNLPYLKKALDICIICLPEIKQKKFYQIEESIKKIFKKIDYD